VRPLLSTTAAAVVLAFLATISTFTYVSLRGKHMVTMYRLLAKAFVFRWTVDGELTRDQPVSERIPMICIGTAMMPKRELKYLLTP